MQWATHDELEQLAATIQRMNDMLHRDRLEKYMALKEEIKVFHNMLQQRAAQMKGRPRRKLTSCQLLTKGRPISCSVPPGLSCQRT